MSDERLRKLAQDGLTFLSDLLDHYVSEDGSIEEAIRNAAESWPDIADLGSLATPPGGRAMSGPTYLGNPHDHPIWQELADALDAAMTKHASMHSPHEGHSVIREELDELWEHVRADTGRSAKARKEALQLAAMGIRYALDLCSTARLAPSPAPQEPRDALEDPRR